MSIVNPTKVSGLFAFWRYDQYPYVLGGVVDMMDDNGLVRIPNYGNGWFNPIKLMPIKKGKALLDTLKGQPNGLEYLRREDLDVFESRWDRMLFAILPEAAHPGYARHRDLVAKMEKEKKKRG